MNAPPTPDAVERAAAEPGEHELKVWCQFFEALQSGVKTFEYRRDDRGFTVGDVLRLREWSLLTREYTGWECKRRVTYIARDEGVIPAGFCVMSIEPLAATRASAVPEAPGESVPEAVELMLNADIMPMQPEHRADIIAEAARYIDCKPVQGRTDLRWWATAVLTYEAMFRWFERGLVDIEIEIETAPSAVPETPPSESAIDDLLRQYERACAAVVEQGDSNLSATTKERAIYRNEVRSALVAGLRASRETAREIADVFQRRLAVSETATDAPTLQSLIGVAPNLTGAMQSEDYVRALRDSQGWRVVETVAGARIDDADEDAPIATFVQGTEEARRNAQFVMLLIERFHAARLAETATDAPSESDTEPR